MTEAPKVKTGMEVMINIKLTKMRLARAVKNLVALLCGIDRTMPGYQYDFSDGASSCAGNCASNAGTDELVANIVKKVMAELK